MTIAGVIIVPGGTGSEVEEEDDDDFQAQPSKVKGAASRAKPRTKAAKGKSKPGRKAAAAATAADDAPATAAPREEATFDNTEFALWAPEEQTLPRPLPRTIRTLELFAGCGGLHGDGSGTLGDLSVEVKTVAAVEVEAAPAVTYAANFPAVGRRHNMAGWHSVTPLVSLLCRHYCSAAADGRHWLHPRRPGDGAAHGGVALPGHSAPAAHAEEHQASAGQALLRSGGDQGDSDAGGLRRGDACVE